MSLILTSRSGSEDRPDGKATRGSPAELLPHIIKYDTTHPANSKLRKGKHPENNYGRRRPILAFSQALFHILPRRSLRNSGICSFYRESQSLCFEKNIC